MDTVTESNNGNSNCKSWRNWSYSQKFIRKKTNLRNKKGKRKKLLVGAAVGAGTNEFERAKEILKCKY